MQQHSLLQTKLYVPPVRPELVSRPRLTERLNAGLKDGDAFPRVRDAFPRTRDAFPRALTLVSAPAGFGKTTLVSEWVQGIGEATLPVTVAWLSLDEGDNDPARFLTYLLAALRKVEAELAGELLCTLQSPQPPATVEALTILINEVARIPDRIILVLDDYHLIEAQEIHDALTFLLEHLPPQMHLVIATRDDPRLPLARLRARGQLTELRASDLRFTSAEAARFLNQAMDLELSAEDIAALETRTEGWIAGLHLAALVMQGTPPVQGRRDTSAFVKSFTGSHRFVLDYLIEEVLDQQPAGIQTCLLQTSILDRLTAPLCEAVCSAGPSGNGQELLEKLDRANLFIVPLDEERRWYRYHHLFAELLRQRLGQTQPEWVPELHRRASVWHEQNGFLDEAIEHALHTQDFERAASLIEQHVDEIWQRGEHTRLRRWLSGLSGELVDARPHLCILRAWDMFTHGQQDAAEQCLQTAERAIEAGTGEARKTMPPVQDQRPDLERRMIQGRAAAIRGFLAFYRGDAQGTFRHARRALELLPEHDLTWRSTATVALGDAYSFAGQVEAAERVRLEALEASKAAGNTYMILIAGMKLAVTLRQRGQLQRVMVLCQQQRQLADDAYLSRTVVAGWLWAVCGEVLAERNELDAALHQGQRGVELTERGRDVAMIGWSNMCLARILFSRGDLAGVEGVVRKMDRMARELYVPPWITSGMAAWQVRTWLAQGNLDAAAQWVAERGLDAEGDLAYLHEMEYMALARIWIAQRSLEEAVALLQRLPGTTEMGGHTSRAIEILMLQALALQDDGDTGQAVETLERALTLAEPGGFIRSFVDEGPPMARLLYEAAARGIAPDYARRLLAAFPAVEHGQPGSSETQTAEPNLVETLSERELEVLHLVAQGLTNREIAARLYLSLNTVKAHNRNINGKLGTHSRTHAVARARSLGILPSG